MGKKGKKAKDAKKGGLHRFFGRGRQRGKQEDDMIYDWDDAENYMRGEGWVGRGPGMWRKSEPPAPPDPDILRAVTDYRIYTGTDDLEGLTKPLTWFLAGNGLVPVRQAPLGVFVGKATGQVPATLKGLPALNPALVLNVPRLPWAALCEVVAFFRHYKHTECMVQFFWSQAANGGQGGYLAYIPPQVVSGASVQHAGHFDKEGQCIHVLDIHSHSSMGAFWSGTDDADERRFEGRLFGVIGHNDKKIPMMKWRTCVGGEFVDLALSHVVDVDNAPSVTIPATTLAIDEVLTALGNEKGGVANVKVEYDPFEDATFPDEWKTAVKEQGFRIIGMGDDADEKPMDARVRKVTYKTIPTGSEQMQLRRDGFRPSTASWLVWERDTAPQSGPPRGGNGQSGYPLARQHYVFDRIKRELYFKDSKGDLYKSSRRIHELNTTDDITFVDSVPLNQVKGDWTAPGFVAGRTVVD